MSSGHYSFHLGFFCFGWNLTFTLVELSVKNWNVSVMETGIVANNGTGEVSVDQYHRYHVSLVIYIYIYIFPSCGKVIKVCVFNLSCIHFIGKMNFNFYDSNGWVLWILFNSSIPFPTPPHPPPTPPKKKKIIRGREINGFNEPKFTLFNGSQVNCNWLKDKFWMWFCSFHWENGNNTTYFGPWAMLIFYFYLWKKKFREKTFIIINWPLIFFIYLSLKMKHCILTNFVKNWTVQMINMCIYIYTHTQIALLWMGRVWINRIFWYTNIY